jgi:pimeloyl-ACP methyl ester carboxylesterase
MPLLVYNNFILEYSESGEGDEVLFAFHGFNRSAEDFRVFLPSLGKRYRMVCFNLFYSGGSRIDSSGDHPLLYSDLKSLIGIYLEENHVERFSLLAYSLGGRVALACFELFPEKVSRIYLLAPDGIRVSPWYLFLVRTSLGQRLSRYMIDHPGIFFRLAGWLRKGGFVSESLYNFTRFNTHTREKRQKVYHIWMSLRRIIPDVPRVLSLLGQHSATVHLVMGRYDSVIPLRAGKAFAAKIPGKIFLHIADTGHNLVTFPTNSILEKILKHDV